MKHLWNSLLVAFMMVVFFAGCEEENPGVIIEEGNQALTDSTYVTSTLPSTPDRVVLFEEFTGVKCSNCPTGHAKTDELLSLYPDRFIPVVYHTDFLGTPFSGNPDFRTSEGQQIETLLNAANKPAAAVDRKAFDFGIASTTVNNWQSMVDEQVALDPAVDILLEKVALEERLFRFSITITYLESVSEVQSFTIGFYEDDLVAAQLDGSTRIDDYVHEHVFRDFLTPFQGEPISETTEQGRVIIKEFEVDLDAEWDINKLGLFAFVHNTGTNQQIRQAASIKVKD